KKQRKIPIVNLVSDSDSDSSHEEFNHEEFKADVITCVAHQQNIVEQTELIGHRKEGPLCYLPANLQDDVMNERLTPAKAFVNYQFTFLSAAAICQEVYLPMRDQNHWYLVVISIPEKKVYIADCDADSDKHEIRRREATSFMVRELNLIYFLEFISQLFKLVHTNSGLGKYFPPPSEFELSYEKFTTEKRAGLWVCSSIAYESSMTMFKNIEPGRLMNPKELAVDLVMGFPNFKRNEVLMKTDAAMRNKKVARELKF
ncbi:hypothetical protein LINGRAHAP2_LOCUS20915, partial [Linum grandiflorum]